MAFSSRAGIAGNSSITRRSTACMAKLACSDTSTDQWSKCTGGTIRPISAFSSTWSPLVPLMSKSLPSWRCMSRRRPVCPSSKRLWPSPNLAAKLTSEQPSRHSAKTAANSRSGRSRSRNLARTSCLRNCDHLPRLCQRATVRVWLAWASRSICLTVAAHSRVKLTLRKAAQSTRLPPPAAAAAWCKTTLPTSTSHLSLWVLISSEEDWLDGTLRRMNRRVNELKEKSM